MANSISSKAKNCALGGSLFMAKTVWSSCHFLSGLSEVFEQAEAMSKIIIKWIILLIIALHIVFLQYLLKPSEKFIGIPFIENQWRLNF